MAVAVDNEARADINWSAIFAGLAVAIVTYTSLLLLGVAVGGGTVQQILRGTVSAQTVGIGVSIWTVLAVILSLFVGAYASAVVMGTGTMKPQSARIQGLVVSTLFFILMFTQAGMVLGTLGVGLTSTIKAVGSTEVIPRVGRNLIVNSILDMNLKSSPEDVAQNLAMRVLEGDEEGAINYLAYEAGISPNQARARIDNFKNGLREAATDASLRAASVVRIGAWTLFGSIFLGSLFGVLGGALGCRVAQGKTTTPFRFRRVETQPERRAAGGP